MNEGAATKVNPENEAIGGQHEHVHGVQRVLGVQWERSSVTEENTATLIESRIVPRSKIRRKVGSDVEKRKQRSIRRMGEQSAKEQF